MRLHRLPSGPDEVIASRQTLDYAIRYRIIKEKPNVVTKCF